MLTCVGCGKELSGGLDTFGDDYLPCCRDCLTDVMETVDPVSWYGLAPHHHDMTITGNIFGSTVIDGIPEDNREADGWYKVENGLYFRPDEDAPGCGIWERR